MPVKDDMKECFSDDVDADELFGVENFPSFLEEAPEVPSNLPDATTII